MLIAFHCECPQVKFLIITQKILHDLLLFLPLEDNLQTHCNADLSVLQELILLFCSLFLSRFFLPSKIPSSYSWWYNDCSFFIILCCCCSVTQLYLTLCNPTGCSKPGSSVLHYLLKFTQIHVYWVVMLSNHLSLCCPFLLLPSVFPSIRVFSVSRLFASGGQSIGASASASILPTNIQGWFPLGSTGLISLQSKELSRVFSSTAVWKHQFFGAQPCLWSNSHIHTWLLEKP